MEILNNYIIQLGAIGLIIFGLTYFSRSLFVFFMNQLKDKENENKALEMEFRQYLQITAKELQEIIKEYSNTQKDLIVVLNSFKK